MGFTARLKERVRHFSEKALPPGERLVVAAMVTVGPAGWLDLLLSPLSQTFLHRPYYAVLTDARFVLAKPSVFTGEAAVEFAALRDQVLVLQVREGWRPALHLRKPDGTDVVLEFGRAWRDEMRAIAAGLQSGR